MSEGHAPRPDARDGHIHARREVPLRQSGTFFASMLVGAVAVAVFTGDPGMLWGYIGAFAITITLGIGLALRADQHNRNLQAHRRRH